MSIALTILGCHSATPRVNAHPTSQYLEINSNDGSNSFMREIANTGINAYNISFKLYVPSSRSASFSIYHDLSCNNLDRSYKVNFSGNGLGNVINNNKNLNFSFFNNQWFELSQLIDLDRNIVELYINNNFLLDWQFNSSIHDNYNYNQLGGIVFHSDTRLGHHNVCHVANAYCNTDTAQPNSFRQWGR